MQAPPDPSLTCIHCGEVFQRREHRNRHQLQHTGAKPFGCNICHKSFSRSDTLRRHRALHAINQHSQQGRKTPRVQACLACARLKQRCDSSLPCSRCLLRKDNCVYSSRGPLPSQPASPALVPDTTYSESVVPEQQQPSALPDQRTDEPGHKSSLPEDLLQNPDSNNPRLDIDPSVANHLLSEARPSNPVLCLAGSFSTVSNTCTCANCSFVDKRDHDATAVNPIISASQFYWPLDDFEFDFNSNPHFDFLARSQFLGQPLYRSIPADGTSAASSTGERTVSGSAEVFTPRYLQPENICGGNSRPCNVFPALQPEDAQHAEAEVYGHISSIPDSAAEGLYRFYLTQQTDDSLPNIPKCVLHAFVELYFEHFDTDFPFLHPSRLEAQDLSWILLLATAAVGSHYSEGRCASTYNTILNDLLARAVKSASFGNLTSEIVAAQARFLLHVLWMFSGSLRDRLMLQHQQSSLVTLCRELVGQHEQMKPSSALGHNAEQEWQAWLADEEFIRLVTSVRALENLGAIFLEAIPTLNLRTFTRQLPSSDSLWSCRSAIDWCNKCKSLTSDPGARSHAMFEHGPFAFRVVHLEFFVDEKNLARQVRCSQATRASVASSLGLPSHGAHQTLAWQAPVDLDEQEAERGLLDTAFNTQVLQKLNDVLLEAGTGQTDTLLHVLVILRHVPLMTLHWATGWQTTKEQKLQSKSNLRDFFHQHGSRARSCLLHACLIFRMTRVSQRGACYDVFSRMVAVCYIYCYIELCTAKSNAASSSQPQQRPSIVRLDQVGDKASIEQWIENGGDSVVHLTGVGLLNGTDACARFLRDVEKSLLSQVAWKGLCRGFAACFAQLRHGENPTSPSNDPKDSEGDAV